MTKASGAVRATKQPLIAPSLVLVVIMMFGAIGCPQVFIPADARAILESPGNYEQVRALPLKKQLEIYRYGMKWYHPPRMDLAFPIAQGGKAIIPELFQAFYTEADDVFKADIMRIFSSMVIPEYTGGYSIWQDEEVMAELTRAVASIHDASARRRAQGYLARLNERYPPEERQFFSQSLARQQQLFPTLSIERQLRIYRAASSRDIRREKATRAVFAQALTAHGQTVIPSLLQALQAEPEERVRAAFICIFVRVTPRYYAVEQDEDVMGQLRAAAAVLIPTGVYAEEARECLAKLGAP